MSGGDTHRTPNQSGADDTGHQRFLLLRKDDI